MTGADSAGTLDLDDHAGASLRGGWAGSRDEQFTTFMRTAQAPLGRMAWLLTGDVHRAEDLVQHTLVRTYAAWPRARATDPMAYARKVLANARIDTWRKHHREHLSADPEGTGLTRPATPAGTWAGTWVGTTAPSPEQRHVDRDAVVRALRQLSPRRRRVVVLRYLMDLPEQQVADDLSISVGTVKSTAARGLAQLRRLLDQPPPPSTSTETSTETSTPTGTDTEVQR